VELHINSHVSSLWSHFSCSLCLGLSTWSIFTCQSSEILIFQIGDAENSGLWGCHAVVTGEHLLTVRWIVRPSYSGSSSRRRLDKFKFTSYVLHTSLYDVILRESNRLRCCENIKYLFNLVKLITRYSDYVDFCMTEKSVTPCCSKRLFSYQTGSGTHPPSDSLVTGALSPGVKRLELDLPPSRAENKNQRIFASTSSCAVLHTQTYLYFALRI
jgi:hypothetical protein